jgi:hypothetical protein
MERFFIFDRLGRRRILSLGSPGQFRLTRAPLPPVLPEVTQRPPIISPSSTPEPGNRNSSPPRSMIAGAQNLSESSGEEYDRATPLKVPDRELF